MSSEWKPIEDRPDSSDTIYEIRFESGRVMPGHFISNTKFKTREEGIVIDIVDSDVDAYRLFGPSIKEDVDLKDLHKIVKGYMSFVREKERHPENGKHNVFEAAIIAFYGPEGYDFIEKITNKEE